MTDLDSALAAAAASGRPLLVALDFDGTLAPFVDNPDDATMTPAARVVVDALAASPRVQLAFVSGRNLASLARQSAPPPGTWLVGSHGAEHGHVTTDGTIVAEPLTLTDEQDDQLWAATSAFERIAADVAGAWVEHKPSAVVLHTRRVADETRAEIAELEASEAAHHLGLTSLHGKKVVEAAVIHTSKGTALARLRTQLAGRPIVIFAGDDVTDEFAFAALDPAVGDIGIKVGPGPTQAAHRLPSLQALPPALTPLAAPYPS
ncbi:MAG: trehalose-phosphatase [Cellulomonadaceae bacterium]|jgi:trehalose-phosphatase|nr:trehalose-phosphatase [Cellulomonadaceae bacterium]